MATHVHDFHDGDHHGKLPWRAIPVKRTQAIPKHSLFGTALEKFDKESLKDIQGRYIPEGPIKQPPNRYPLPDHIKASIPGRESLETSRREILAQHNLLSEADESLKNKSEKVLSFKDISGQRISKSSNSKRSGHHGWFTESDLEHSKEINIVGLNSRENYNRDKYSKKQKSHNYSLIGNLLAPNMDFPLQEDERRDIALQQNSRKNTIWGPGRHLTTNITDNPSKSCQNNSYKSLIDLPPNIRHKFGSRECDNLLSDKNLVHLALERQREKSGPQRPSKKEKIEALPVDMSDNYTSLGHMSRYNVCSGVSSGQTISRTKAEFNDEVHLKRVPDTDEFRCQRDELSIWVEQDVLRKRMENKWKFYFDTLPKAAANWDRSAKRPAVTVPQTPKPKPQPTPKNKRPTKPDAKKNEDEIIFVTPPLTPLPQEEERIELPKSFEKDKEFWGFYDQAGP